MTSSESAFYNILFVLLGLAHLVLPVLVTIQIADSQQLRPPRLPSIQLRRPHTRDTRPQRTMGPRAVQADENTEIYRGPWVSRWVQVGDLELQSAQWVFYGRDKRELNSFSWAVVFIWEIRIILGKRAPTF